MNKIEHEKRTKERYGFEAGDIHSFLDEPVRAYGKEHRGFRHDTETIKLVGNLFGSKYTREIAENIALDHIIADHEEEIGHRTAQKTNKDSSSQLQLETKQEPTENEQSLKEIFLEWSKEELISYILQSRKERLTVLRELKEDLRQIHRVQT